MNGHPSEPFFFEPERTQRRRGIGILLIHGFTGTPANMRDMGNFFVHEGYYVHGMRIAGHGTHPNDLNATGIHDWLASAEEAVRKLQNVAEKISVIGFSFGGNIALHLASTFPEKIQSVVVIGTPLFIKNPVTVRLKSLMSRVLRISYVAKTSVQQALPLVAESGSYNVWPTTATRRLLSFLRHDARTALGKVYQPIFIVHSVGDTIVHPKSAQAIYNAVPSMRKEIFWLTHSPHYPIDSAQKEDVHHRIHEFIQQTETPQDGLDEEDAI